MATILIENVPESVVKIYGTRIKYTEDLIFPNNVNLKNSTLLEYINSDEYKNEEKNFVDYEDFIEELRFKLNTGK